MSASLAMSTAPVERRAEDRWLGRGAPVERASRWMGVVLLASVGLHAGIVATALFTAPIDTQRPGKEIAVEIVQEIPKRPPHEAARPPAAPAPKPAFAKSEAPAAATPPPLRAAAAPRSESQAKPAAADERIKALQSELEALRTARAELEAERAAQTQAERAAQSPTTPATDGLGPLPDSFQAVALPTSADGIGEAVGYQAIVFSQLAKAKDIGRHLGLPGSAGVRFEVDAQGRLTAAEVVVSSGVASLDAEALAIVRRAAPFPAPPQGAQRAFSANVNFVAEAQK